jgi:2-oxoisovalerate dehydrogenase E1 component
MVTARWIDRVEMELIHRGEAFFHVGGAGHEVSAALAFHLVPEDWLHLHYRDKALMLARGMTPLDFFHGLLCTRDSHSAGRQMSAHLSAPALNVLSMVGPVGNNALQAVGVAHELQHGPANRNGASGWPIVVCAMGDGTTQQGEVLEAISEAARGRLPVLFLVEDNGLAISTHTRGRTFYQPDCGTPASAFMGIPIHRLDGTDALGCLDAFGEVVRRMRRDRAPAIVVLQVERLTHHTNADDERVYRPEAEITSARQDGDPIVRLSRQLEGLGVEPSRLESLGQHIEQEVRAAAAAALDSPNPDANHDAREPWNGPGPHDPPAPASAEPVTLLAAMRSVLRDALQSDPRVSLLGEDIEDPKGDVFGLTRGLSRAFPGRVNNSALSESLIVGVSIGRALAGGRPVALVQFADFLPLCFNQVASELGSMWWRTRGGWRAPVVVMAPCGGYRPGLGPFHAQTLESTFAHVPGLDVLMPSNAHDAAGMLRAALEGGRPTLFLYPKVLLNDASVAASHALDGVRIPPGHARRAREGADLTLVGWGATVPLCERAAAELATAGVQTDVLDLRSISPWDEAAVLESVRKTRRLIVVHEDNRTCGFGAEVASSVAEKAGIPVQVRRLTRPDTYVPCNYANQLEVLPSVGGIVRAAAEWFELVVLEEAAPDDAPGAVHVLEAAGTSPADQNVTVIAWKVREGTAVQAGDLLAECEADKATFDLRAPVSGVIHGLLPEDERVTIGTPIARIQTRPGTQARVRRIPIEPRRRILPAPAKATASMASRTSTPAMDPDTGTLVGLRGLSFVTGSRLVTNEELVARFPGRTPGDIVQRTGIESRHWCAPGETVLTLASRAAREAMARCGIGLQDLSGILVSTSTPLEISPSLACRLQHVLAEGGPPRDVAAHDVLAACSGWLYALQQAHDACRARPGARFLVVTAEAMSAFLDIEDFDTAIVFGDAATAVVVEGGSAAAPAPLRLHRPLLSARGEDGAILSVGRIRERACSPVSMHGVKVFPLAVRQMNAMLRDACADAGTTLPDLDWIVPHQANGRIIAAAQQRSGVPPERVVSNVAHHGNTSSSSIPIALAEMLAEGRRGRVGMAAFGGGFTFAAAVAEMG